MDHKPNSASETKLFSLRLDGDVRRMLESLAQRDRRTMTGTIAWLIEQEYRARVSKLGKLVPVEV